MNCLFNCLFFYSLVLTCESLFLNEDEITSLKEKTISASRFRRQTDCGDTDFQCNSGQCIDFSLECDGIENCRDGSDETTDCKKIRCDNFLFQCDYGACISKSSLCDGKKDCKDNSDERPPVCNTTTIGCTQNEFRCTSGQCISEFDVCDGKADCSDKSDETAILCSELKCPFAFQCAYGACVANDAKCNGVQDCVDGSDEDPSLCPTVTKKPPVTVTNKPIEASAGECILPNHPNHGSYSIYGNLKVPKPGDVVTSGTVLTFTCNRKYIPYPNITFNLCQNSLWVSAIPNCIRVCDSAMNINKNTLVECTRYNSKADCEYPIDGTRAKFTCKPYHEDLNLNKRNVRICRDGTWDLSLPTCTPVCGQKVVDGQELVIGGKKAKKGSYPWHVAVYEKNGNITEHICGGTIINLHAILSAAHCFTAYNGSTRPAERYVIGAGKYYRSFDNSQDVDTRQFSDVKAIKVPERYYGNDGNYALDIAVVILKKEFKISRHVQPICIDWANYYGNSQLITGNKGTVVGWGFTASDNPSEELQELDVPYIPHDECRGSVKNDFIKFITEDKICAGYTSKGKNVCKGDSGGGLIFPSDENRYYIRGIVSISPKKGDSCDPDQYTLYTKISYHIRNGFLDQAL